jgi:Flp pilus assembly protein TadD
MLALKPEYRPKFPEFMQTMAAGGPCEAIFELVYGKTMSQIEKELIQYVNGTRFQGVLVPAKLGKLDGDLKPEPAPDFDVKLVLAEIGEVKGKEEVTRQALEELVATDPKRIEPYEDLARLALRQHRMDDARVHLTKAFDLGSRNPETLWNFGLMAQGSDPEKSAQAFTELLKQQPERVDTRLALASLQLRKHQAKDALETLAPVKKITPQQAPQLLTLLAHANFEAGDREKAHTAAAQLKSIAKTPEDRDRADQILRYVDGSKLPSITAEAGAPVLTRRDAPVSTVREVRAPGRASFSGKFVELQCGPQARIVLDTAEGKKRLLIDDPSKLMINGNGGEKMELACGAQKPKQVRIEYDEAGAAHPGVDGLARGIQFNP